jgi:single-strand DNA-binding protein
MEAALRARLEALPPAAGAELVHVLQLPDFDRADRIGEFWGYPQSREFAELLIDCEEDRTLRAVTASVNVVVRADTIAADPVERRMPSGEECTELRLSVPEPERRLLPLPVVAWQSELGKCRLKGLAKGDEVLVYGRLVRRFYRSGAGARSLTEVVASGIRRLEHPEPDRDEARDEQGPG